LVQPYTPSGDGGVKNFTETQQTGHTPRPGPNVKDGRSSAKDGALERLRCRTIEEMTNIFCGDREGGAPLYDTLLPKTFLKQLSCIV